MKKKLYLSVALMMMVAFMLIPSLASATEVKAGVATFGVVMNGHRVDNEYRKYPLIVYNSITYFPMTYNDCAFLGVSNNWSPETGNVIDRAEPSSFFDDSLNPLYKSHSGIMAKVVTTPVKIQGVQLNNAAEQYPILNYNDMLYFPLTWDWAQKFGWTVDFKNRNLEITTEGFEGKGKVVMYDVANGGAEKIIEKLYYNRTDYHKDEKGSVISSSENYTFYPDPLDGFVSLYRLYDDGNYHPFNHINIKKEMAAPFLENGWFEASNIEAATHEYLKTHTKNATNGALSALMRELTSNSALTNSKVSDLMWNFLSQYTGVYALPDKFTNVRNEEAQAYKNAGWMTAQEYLDAVVWQRENAGDYEGALRILESVYGGYTKAILGYDLPPIAGLNYYYVEEQPAYMRVFKKLYPNLKNNLAFAYSYSDTSSVNLIFRGQSVKGLKDFHFTVSYDMYDISGNYLGTAKEDTCVSFWMNNGDQLSESGYSISKYDHPGLHSVANVKISNLKITDFEPGYEG